MATIHISAAEAARDLPGLLDRARSGVEVVIDDSSPAVRLSVVTDRPDRLVSESLRLARDHASTATLDADFGRDLEAVIESNREPLDPPERDIA